MKNKVLSISLSLSYSKAKMNNILFEIYDLFCKKIGNINSLENYAKFTKQLTKLINYLIKNYLDKHPDIAKNAVLKGNLMGFNWTNSFYILIIKKIDYIMIGSRVLKLDKKISNIRLGLGKPIQKMNEIEQI